MNNHLIRPLEYWWINHPLTGEDTVIGDDHHSRKIINEIYQTYRFAPVRFRREIVLPIPVDANRVKLLVKKYEFGLWKKWHQIADQRRFREFFWLGIAFCLSYLIWNIPWLYAGIDQIFSILGDYLKLPAKIIITLAPVAISLYYRILSLGKLEKLSRPLDFYPHLDDSLQTHFYKNLQKLKSKVIRRLGLSHPVSDIFSSLVQALEKQESSENWREYFQKLEKLAMDLPPDLALDVTAMLDDLRFYGEYNFAFAPLVIISPESERGQKWNQFLKKTQNLREEFQQRFRLLRKAATGQERILLVNQLKNISIKLFRQASEDQFETLRGLYYCLETGLGKLAHQLRKKRIIFKNFREKRLILRWEKDVNRFLNVETRKIRTSSPAKSSFLSFTRESVFREWGSWPAGIVLALSLLALVMLLTGFYFLDHDEFSVINHYRFGYRGLVGRRVEVVEYNRRPLINFPVIQEKLFWGPPKPLAFIHQVSPINQELRFFFPLQEEEPDTRWKKILHSLKPEWGRGIVGIEVILKYEIQNKLQWAQLDYDSLGKIRLKHELYRKLSEHVDYNRSLLREQIYEEAREDLGEHFRKLRQEGQLEKMIKNALRFSVPLGSTKYALQLLKDEPTIASNPAFKKELEDEIKKTSLKLKTYYEEINLQPELLKAILENTEGELAKYPELFRSLFYLISESMITQRTLQMVRESLQKEKEDPLTQGFLDYLRKESRLEEVAGIKILEMQREVRDISARVYYTEVQKERDIY